MAYFFIGVVDASVNENVSRTYIDAIKEWQKEEEKEEEEEEKWTGDRKIKGLYLRYQ